MSTLLDAMSLPLGMQLFWWSAIGLFVGSFLNVAIHRLPLENETVAKPARSRCPNCRRALTWKENVPLLSWLVQRGRCRGCGWRIPWRYPLVELLTAALWYWIAMVTLPTDGWALTVVRTVIVSGLIVATFVDFDRFEIPDEISIGGMVLAPVAALLLPAIHDHTWIAVQLTGGGEFRAVAVTRLAALCGCLGGMAVGGGVLWAIGWLGSRIYGRDAMGFGDVKLLAAGGGFVGPGGALVSLMIASLFASVAGLGNMGRFFVLHRLRARRRGTPKSLSRSLVIARLAGRYVPFGPYLALGIGIVLVYWNDVLTLLLS